ncbi:hypothetical protein HCB25_03435 [Listeria booriae]|uniref:Bacterial Ig domain-containing protein n=1 Tax=Listeria booriae TaxID=1552123 RepID=A0A842FJF2_9LIST|nr:toxin Cry1Ac domain D-VI-related protein [Listeria booriae]MBC2243106.1 hypothetical protein [Listeria booriae]
MQKGILKNILLATAIVSAGVLGNIGIAVGEANAAEVNTTISNPAIIDVSSFTNWSTKKGVLVFKDGIYTADYTTDTYTQTGNVFKTSANRTVTLDGQSIAMYMPAGAATGIHYYLYKGLKTEIGKEYTVAFDAAISTNATTGALPRLQVESTGANVKTVKTDYSATYRQSITFTATGQTTTLIVGLEKPNFTTTYSAGVKLTNFASGKSETQIAKEKAELENQADTERHAAARDTIVDLFENGDVTGAIKEDTDQAAIDYAKTLVADVTDPSNKAELEQLLAEAQKQLDAKIAEKEMKKVQQEEAKAAVEALFQKEDIAGAIKSTTNQALLDAAQQLVDKVADNEQKVTLQTALNNAQNQLNARIMIDFLFENGNVDGEIKASTDQSAIDLAQRFIGFVTGEAAKEPLQQDLNKAIAQLSERERLAYAPIEEAVKALFENDNVTGNIKTSTDQSAIDSAKELVATIKNASKKAELETYITEAQQQLDARNAEIAAELARQQSAREAINNLFENDDITTTIKETTDQTAIEAAQAIVDTVTDSKLQATLQADLDKAKAQLKIRETQIELGEFRFGDAILKGTHNNADITKMNIVVDGVTYWGGTVTEDSFKFYSLYKIGKYSENVEVNFFNSQNELITTEKLIPSPKPVGEITNTSYKVGESNIYGTFSGDVDSITVEIDGKLYYGGTVYPDGAFKFYGLDKKIKADSEVIIRAYSLDKTYLGSSQLEITL